MKVQAICTTLLLGVVLAAATGCSDGPGAGAGGLRVLEGNDARAVAGTEIPVLVPNGSFVFTVSEPGGELPEGEPADSAGDAGSATSYVGISWRSDTNPPEFGPVLHGTQPLPAPVRVVQGDDEAEVTELGPSGPTATDFNSSGVAWVALVEDGPGLTLEVEYDGLVQTFDLTTGEREAGPADGFYEDTGTGRTACLAGEPADARWRADVDCKVTEVAAVPYVAEHGWAEEGRTWLVFGIFLTPGDDFTLTEKGTEATYRVARQQGTVRSGEDEAVVLSQDGDALGGSWSASLAVQVDADAPATLEVSRDYDVMLDTASGPADVPPTATVTYTATVDLPPAAA
ncbi:hypothetical protein [Nocardioides sp. cx-173]|uniref:hypothetical protein n=1 Tax=Nocardioides sp. cx-173 TaxID=2898796 RepID=UPI001E4E3A1A|nr:hypothetical protein [Nocardioides sp. cx-173]MCD4524460.1 hypothetical protein [Nocardioides sp. cx-173]UGB43054.1 hypothetical protein LQ940_05895 [Nocardioides sp. cx-173]